MVLVVDGGGLLEADRSDCGSVYLVGRQAGALWGAWKLCRRVQSSREVYGNSTYLQ
jgi:hypothetical protein